MRRRRQFYADLGKEPGKGEKSAKGAGGEVREGEGGGEEEFLPQDSRFFSQDDSISLSLEYYNNEWVKNLIIAPFSYYYYYHCVCVCVRK